MRHLKNGASQQQLPVAFPHIRTVKQRALIIPSPRRWTKACSALIYTPRLRTSALLLISSTPTPAPTRYYDMFFRRKREAASWEVVEYKIVEPVPVCDEDDEGEPSATVSPFARNADNHFVERA